MDRDLTTYVDIHSHLVPDVDDGARTVQDTLESVEAFTRVGIRKILTTPHLNGSLTNEPEVLGERLGEVDAAWAEAVAAVERDFPEVELARGHEVMLDVPEVDFSDPRVRLAGTSFVLIEWPRLHVPPGTVHVLERIMKAGYRPIIAHPERYLGIDKSFSVVGEWREVGAYLQVNYGSLFGRYGSGPRTVADYLLRRGWANYLASDFHGHASQKMYFKEICEHLQSIEAYEALKTLCQINPSRVLRDEEPLPVPLLPPDTGLWAKFKGVLG